jgi:hypothetical protein
MQRNFVQIQRIGHPITKLEIFEYTQIFNNFLIYLNTLS